MLLAEQDIIERIESPLNLLNRLRKTTSLATHPSLPPSSSDIIPDLEKKLDYGSSKQKAIAIMNESMDLLKVRLAEVSKPRELAAIAAEMGKVIANTEVKREDERPLASVVIYAPSVVHENNFPILDLESEEG